MLQKTLYYSGVKIIYFHNSAIDTEHWNEFEYHRNH